MLRLRFDQRVPDHAVNVSYVQGGDLSTRANVALIGMSHERVENLSAYVGGELDVPTTGSGNRVDTKEAVLSNRSVLSREVRRPAPLYYKYVIGRGIYSVDASVPDAADTQAAHDEILKQLEFLDRYDNKIRGPDWDIEVTSPGAGGAGFVVVMYLSRRQAQHETFKVRYQGIRDADSAPFPNRIEVINAVPILAEGVDYTLQNETDGYSIQGLASSNSSPAIGLFYNGTGVGGGATVNATHLNLLRDAGGVYSYAIAGKSVEDMVQEINAAGVEYEAVALSNNPVLTLLVASYSVPPGGRAIVQNDVVRVKYNEETRVSALRPYNDQPMLPWYPRVDKGQFNQLAQFSGSQHRFVFRPLAPDHFLEEGRTGYTNTFDRMDEKPVVLTDKMLQLRRPNLVFSTLKLEVHRNDVTSNVGDYDTLNSILFLDTPVGDTSELFASYSYMEDSFVYTGVDLNPLGWHTPRLLGRYVGLYITPAEILGSSPQSFSRTVYHVIGNDVPTIKTMVANVRFDNSDSAHALLLGVYRVGRNVTLDEIKTTDTRTRGGGLVAAREPADIENAREAEMFMDISMWDGEPFPPTAVVFGVPQEVIGTGQPGIERHPSLLTQPSGFHYPSGLLKLDQVQGKANRYKAGGVLAIVSPEPDLNG